MNLAEQAYQAYKKTEELERQQRVVIARDLYEGHVDAALLAQLDNAMPGSTAWINSLFNTYATVIDELLNRLHIKQWVDAPEAGGQPVAWANELWQHLDMDEKQYTLFEWALVDGEAFVILAPGWNQATSKTEIRPFLHRRWTSAEVGGDNEGCKAHYQAGQLGFVSKRWIETYTEGSQQKQRQRMTLYFSATETEAGRVEKYVIVSGVPVPFTEDKDPVIAWPYAYPLIHIQNVGGRQQGQRAQGPQILLDNIVADFLTASGSQASPMLTVVGGYPTTDGKPPAEDGGNVWRTGPGQIIGFPNKRPDEAKVDHIKPGDLSQLLDSIDKTVIMTALTTGTPSLIANLTSGSATSAEFLKQTDIRPTAATRQRQAAFGNALARMMRTCAALSNALIPGSPAVPDGPLHAEWLAADVRGLHPGDDDENESAPVEDTGV